MSLPSADKPANRLLAGLPPEEYQRLQPYLEPVKLSQHKILYHAGENYNYAYFPCNSIISSISIMKNGSTTEIGVIGSEGMVGLPIILDSESTNTTAIVQVGNGGYKIAARVLREEFNRQGVLQRLLMRYVQARIIQLGQTAACNRYHTLEQRFARWLLMIRDNIQRDDFQLTQEFISQMLGVRRTGISEVANRFRRAGIIEYQRGSIRIVSPDDLKSRSCECYELVAQEFTRLLG